MTIGSFPEYSSDNDGRVFELYEKAKLTANLSGRF